MDIERGNFNGTASLHRGWVMGHFMEEGSPFKTESFEIKWGRHQAGEHKEIAAHNDTAKSLAILIRGEFVVSFGDKEIVLNKEGDYVFWESGVVHSWRAKKDSLVITIRWPSVPEDQKPTH